MLGLELGGYILGQGLVHLQSSQIGNGHVGKDSHAFDVPIFDLVVSPEELDQGYLEVVAAHIEETDVDGVCVVPRDGKVHSYGRVLVDDTQHAHFGEVGSIDEGELGLEPPMGRHRQNSVLDVGPSLF